LDTPGIANQRLILASLAQRDLDLGAAGALHMRSLARENTRYLQAHFSIDEKTN